MDLSNAQKEFLALADSVDRVKGLPNIKAMFGGRKEMENGIDELMDMSLIEKKAHGVWKITDKGEDQTVSQVCCSNCGRVFSSIQQAQDSGLMNCGHDQLEYSLKKFSS